MNFDKKITENTLVDYPRLESIKFWLNVANHLEGSNAEVGVYKGGTAYLIAQQSPNKKLYLFDTFEGMPGVMPEIDKHHKGDFKDTSIREVYELLKEFYNFSLHPGIFPETSNVVPTNELFSFVHLDCDIYDSVKQSLEFFRPKMVSGGIILIDDYNEPNCPGAKLAVDEFMEEIDKKISAYCQSQAVIIF